MDEFLKENIPNEEYIVVAVSGGVDSMVLLSLALNYSNNVVCAHVHHNLRKESDEEQQLVEAFCKNNHIIFEATKFEYEEKFTEQIARNKRYKFFEEILSKYGSTTLLTGHHGDDLIETVLMRIVRGSTLKGYAGIEQISKREMYTILRPLLSMNKEEIYEYAKNHSVPYMEDVTNEEDAYTRNRFRNNILPFLKEECKDVNKKFLKFSKELLDYHYYVDGLIPTKIGKMDEFKNLDLFIQKQDLKKFLQKIYKEDINKITDTHIDNTLKLIHEGEHNSTINLPDGYIVTKEYDGFKIEKPEQIEGYEYILDKKLELPNNKTIEQVEESDDTSNNVTYLNSSEIELPLTIRTYKNGDKTSIKNMDGTKKITDIFTDEKVRTSDRETWPIVVDNKGEIVWMPGLKKTKFDRTKSEKYDIILKYY